MSLSPAASSAATSMRRRLPPSSAAVKISSMTSSCASTSREKLAPINRARRRTSSSSTMPASMRSSRRWTISTSRGRKAFSPGGTSGNPMARHQRTLRSWGTPVIAATSSRSRVGDSSRNRRRTAATPGEVVSCVWVIVGDRSGRSPRAEPADVTPRPRPPYAAAMATTSRTERPAGRTIVTRRLSFGPTFEHLDRHFAADDDLVMSHAIAVLSAVFPDGEDYFVRHGAGRSRRDHRPRAAAPGGRVHRPRGRARA